MLIKKLLVIIAIPLIIQASCAHHPPVAHGQDNAFGKIRYLGGSVKSDVNPDDWGNTLVVTSEEISLILKGGKIERIDPKLVTGLSYGQKIHRGVESALPILFGPVALLLFFAKTRKHYVGIDWQWVSGIKGEVLLQADKDNYKWVLMALSDVTGVPVAVSEEERMYVPTGIKVVIAEKEETNGEKDKSKQ